MALSFVQSASAYTLPDDGTPRAAQAVALTGVGAGNLLVAWVKFEGAATTISVSDGTTTFTNGTMNNHGNGDLHGSWAYLLVGNSGNKTYTATFGASRPYPRIQVYEFAYTGTASFDTQNTGSGTSTAPNSGVVTTTATDEVALGGYGEYSANTPSAPLVNGVAATGSILLTAVPYTSSWYRLLTTTFIGGAASLTLSGSADWLCNVLALKTDAGGGGRTTFNAHPSGLGMQHGMGMTLPNGGRYLP